MTSDESSLENNTVVIASVIGGIYVALCIFAAYCVRRVLTQSDVTPSVVTDMQFVI